MIGAAILGVLAGFLARALVPGKQDIGFLLTIVLGLAGAALGYLLFTVLLGIGDTDAFDLLGLPGAVIGSIILLVVYIKVIEPRSEAKPAAPAAEGRQDRQRNRDRDREHGSGGDDAGGRGGGRRERR